VTEFAERVREVVRHLGRGDVVTYGEVAALAGKPGAARGVGAVLAGSGDDGVPWWRVVNSRGRLGPGHEAEHARRLRAEGVTVDAGFVQFSRSGRRRPRATTRS
jgi:alkylated DNA nucleotide flippase Atl1